MRPRISYAGFLVIVVSQLTAFGQPTEPTPDSSSPLTADTVVATVDDTEIKLGDVDSALAVALQGRAPSAESVPQLRADALDQLVKRALVMRMMEKEGKSVRGTEVVQALEQIKKQAADQKVDFAKALRDRGTTEAQLRDQLAWQLNWSKYVKDNLNDSVLKSYFQSHAREFDGTEVRVSHILLRPDNSANPAEAERLTALADKLREQIKSGKITFEAAAKKISAGPSRRQGGDMGFIPRRGVMLEPFAAAAFKLEVGEISPPVMTNYGMHLILVSEIKPGKKTWLNVKDDLKAPAQADLLDKAANEQRKKSKVEYTGKIPYFKPGTRELVKET